MIVNSAVCGQLPITYCYKSQLE